MLHFLLTSQGFTVSTGVDGTAGFYMANVEKPDLIITDLTMPNMDGIELTRQLRSAPETASIPIFIYTAFGKDDIAAATEAGATRIFHKPINMDDMLAAINEEQEKLKEL